MKTISASWHKSIFTRLLLVFLIILVPLYFGGIAIYSWGMAAVQKETLRTISQQGTAWMEGFEREVERIRLLQYECLTDPDLDDLVVRAEALDSIRRTQAINRLLNRLATIQSSSRYISHVSMYVPAMGRTLLSRGSVTELNQEEFEKLRADAAGIYPLVFRGNAAYLAAAYPIQNLSGNRPARVVVAVELSLAEIQRSIAEAGSGRGMALIGQPGLLLSSGIQGDAARQMAEASVPSPTGHIGRVTAGSIRYLVSRADSQALGLLLLGFVPEAELYAPLNRYRLWFWLFTVAAVIIITLFTVASRRLIDRPLNKLVQSFRRVETGDLDVRIEHHADDEFRYLYRRFNDMGENLKTLIDQVYRQKILAQRAELKHLQSQINPHFLYNSFFLLQNMVERGDNEGASAFTRQLGAYFQFVTRSGADEIELEKEAAHARAYAQIQARRFRGRIAVEFGDVPERFTKLAVPRLILQPLLENAFEHGLEHKTSEGMLRVSFKDSGSHLKTLVEDNGGDMTATAVAELNALLDSEIMENMETTALINIHRRLRLRFGENAGLRFSIGNAGGLLAELTIPVSEEGNDVQIADR